MLNSNQIPIIGNVDSGMLDLMGTGNVINGQAEFYPLPLTLSSMPQNGWYVAQWGQPVAVGVANYTTNNPATYDQLYGNSLYSYSQPNVTSSISVYQNTQTLGGGDVVQITDGNTLLPPSSGQTCEADEFLSSPQILPALGNLGNPVTLSVSLKILQSITQYTDAAAAYYGQGANNIFSAINIGFTIGFAARDGVPAYTGFVQIVPWVSDTTLPTNYYSYPESSDITNDQQFVSSLLLPSDAQLPLLSSDVNALPETLTFNLNQYVYKTISYEFQNLTAAQQAVVLNLSNWTVGGLYIGLATNDAQFSDPSSNWQVTEIASISSALQISNLSLTTDTITAYNPNSPGASVVAIDPNPTIGFYDSTFVGSGSADGGLYTGALSGIQDQYFYSGFDNIDLTVTNGEAWLIGSGNGNTTINAGNGAFSLDIKPSSGTQKDIILTSAAKNIYFDGYMNFPTIVSQAISNGILAVDLSDHTMITMPDRTGIYATAHGNQLNLSVPCFLVFTNIMTPFGNVSVQNLKIGDLVLTASGKAVPVKWIGRRSYKGEFARHPDAAPIQIKAGAIAAGILSDDLFVSPRHGIFFDDKLIPAGVLVNNRSIISRDDFMCIDYFHVELENHEIIFANNTPSETFVDLDSRYLFDNSMEYEQLYPDTKSPQGSRYPRCEVGEAVEYIRSHLAASPCCRKKIIISIFWSLFDAIGIRNEYYVSSASLRHN